MGSSETQPKDYSMPNVVPELRVASKSPVGDLAAAISHAIYEHKRVDLRAIGAGAVNQAVKAIAASQGHVGQRGLVLACRPGFTTINLMNTTTGKDEERSAILFHVFLHDQ